MYLNPIHPYIRFFIHPLMSIYPFVYSAHYYFIIFLHPDVLYTHSYTPPSRYLYIPSSIYTYLHLSIHSFIYLYISSSIYTFLHLSIHPLSIYTFLHLSIHSFIYPYISSSTCIYTFLYLSIHSFIYPYISSSILTYLHLSLHIFIYLYILHLSIHSAQAVFWHSSAHILGEAMEKHYGGCLCYGPPIENGYYYDMFLDGR